MIFIFKKRNPPSLPLILYIMRRFIFLILEYFSNENFYLAFLFGKLNKKLSNYFLSGDEINFKMCI